MARCPECNAKLMVTQSPDVGDRIFCKACGGELEIVAVKPLELEAVYDLEDAENDLDEFDEDEESLEWDDEDEW